MSTFLFCFHVRTNLALSDFKFVLGNNSVKLCSMEILYLACLFYGTKDIRLPADRPRPATPKSPPPPRTDVLSKIPRPSRRFFGGLLKFFPIGDFFLYKCVLVCRRFDRSFQCNIKKNLEKHCMYSTASVVFMLLMRPSNFLHSARSVCPYFLDAHLFSLGAHFGGAPHFRSVSPFFFCASLGTPFGRLTRPSRRSFGWEGGTLVYSLLVLEISKQAEKGSFWLIFSIFCPNQNFKEPFALRRIE